MNKTEVGVQGSGGAKLATSATVRPVKRWEVKFMSPTSADWLTPAASGRRDSSDSKASLSSSSSSRSSLTLFDSPRTSISSSPPSVHRIATSSTPSLQITPPTPELTPTSSAFDDDLPSDDERSAVWPFSSALLRTRGSSSSSNSSYTSSLFSLSSTSLSSSDRNDGSSMQQSSPSLFLSYLLKYSFPQVPPRSNLTAELTGARQLSEQGAHVDIGGNGGKTGSEPKRRLVDFYFDSSLRP